MNTLHSFRSLAGVAFLLMASLTSMTACETKTPDPITDPPTGGVGQAGYVTGAVTDPTGNPLARATIYTDNTVLKGRGSETTTKADGSYKIQLVSGLGQWIAKGYLLKSYNNRVYKIQLDPENTDSFTEEEKPVRNFRWKLTGHTPDLSLDLYYGGTAEMFRDLNADELWDNENIEFTFKPVGPLIDGSTGKTLTMRANKRYNTFLKDIPIGRYTITAVYKPTGEQLLVSDAWGEGEEGYKPAVTLDFLGTESATRSNSMGIGYTNRH